MVQTPMEINQGDEEGSVEIMLHSKCSNCNVEGHIASDSKCPKKLTYIHSQCIKPSQGRVDKRHHIIRHLDVREPNVNAKDSGASSAVTVIWR